MRQFELRGRYESARRLRAVAGMVFRYAIATGRATRDPSRFAYRRQHDAQIIALRREGRALDFRF